MDMSGIISKNSAVPMACLHKRQPKSQTLPAA